MVSRIVAGAASGAGFGSSLGPIGTAVGGILGGLGSVLGGFGRSNNGPGLGGLVRRGKQLGLHPLAVLGSPIAGNFATPSAPRDVGGGLAGLGEAIGRIGQSVSDRRDAREAADRIRRQDDASIAEAGARTRLYEAQAAELLAAGMGGARAHTQASVANSKRPLTGSMPLYVDATRPDGTTVRFLNPELAEVFDSTIATGWSGLSAGGVVGADPRSAPGRPSQMLPGYSAPPGTIDDTLFNFAP